jgi:alkyl hydroperoxide reductase subunit AhpF
VKLTEQAGQIGQAERVKQTEQVKQVKQTEQVKQGGKMDFDVLVIGGGPGGYVAAIKAA